MSTIQVDYWNNRNRLEEERRHNKIVEAETARQFDVQERSSWIGEAISVAAALVAAYFTKGASLAASGAAASAKRAANG